MPTPPWVGLALDRKAVRGANRHGAEVHWPSLVRNDVGRMLDGLLVSAKTNEITAAPTLLGRQDLAGKVVTKDALLAQRDIAQRLAARTGAYLMVVNASQPALLDALATRFTSPLPDALRHNSASSTGS